MEKNSRVVPVVKWAGGKRQLIQPLSMLLPKRITSYCEPFVGGGALLFSIQAQEVFINDINHELINVYKIIKENVDLLIAELHKHENNADYFYALRNIDRDKYRYAALSPVQRAARIIYLNKTCYNGLFRVNSEGEFNTPFGNYKNPNIVNAQTLKAVNSYFNSATVTITSMDYAAVLGELRKDSFVYLDPPYDPLSDTAYFTGYAKGGFNKAEQIRLRDCCHDLDTRGIRFMLSNSATDFIKDLYAGYAVTTVQAKRKVNSIASKRGEIDELVVRNYE